MTRRTRSEALHAPEKVFDFTNTSVDAIEPPEAGRAEYHDAKNSALTLRVSASGSKTFCIGRKVDGRFVRVTLGTFKRAGDLNPRMTVDMARRELRKADGQIAQGENPNEEKKTARKAGKSLSDWLGDYLSENSKLKDRTRRDYSEVLREFCSDWLDRPIIDITREKVKARHRLHGEERSPARANNAVRVLRALFNFAGVAPNPASSPKRRVAGEVGNFLFDVKRKQTLIAEHDLPAWWQCVSDLAGKRKDSGADTASDLLRVLVLTGLRAREACGLLWDSVDLAGKTIAIEDTKNHDRHVLPMGALLTTIMQRRHAAKTGKYVFSAKDERSQPYNYSTLRGWFITVAAECGVSVTAHDCRRTFATVAESIDVSSMTLKRLLNHRTGAGDVTAGYVIANPERLRSAMQRIEDRVLELAGRDSHE